MLAGALNAQTYITENITTDTTWGASGNPYIIQANVDVLANTTLTIQAGVTVAFDGPFMLNTAWNGVIVAAGAPGNRVIFTSNAGVPQAGDWTYVQVFGPSSSSFEHCTFEYADNGIRSNDAEPMISHCEIRNCTNGIFCISASPMITSCDINACATGIWISGNASNPVINNNNIHDNTNWNLFVTNFPPPAVTIDAENNWWGTDDEATIVSLINDSNDNPAIHATVDFDPWQGGMPVKRMTWGEAKGMYAE